MNFTRTGACSGNEYRLGIKQGPPGKKKVKIWGKTSAFLDAVPESIFKDLQIKACANVFCIFANSLKNSLVAAYFKLSRTQYLTLCLTSV